MKAVELFSVQCTTCRARLKVHDESLIGQIIACLKCGSMVQIAAPQDYLSAAGAKVAAGRSGVRSATAAVIAPPAKKEHATPPLPPPLPHGKSHPTSEAQVSPDAAPAVVPPEPRQDWLLLGAGSLAGALLGLAIWFTLWMLQSPAPGTPGPVASTNKPLSGSRVSTTQGRVAKQTVPVQPAVPARQPNLELNARPDTGAVTNSAFAAETQPRPSSPAADAKAPAQPDDADDATNATGKTLPELPLAAQASDPSPANFPLNPKEGMAAPDLEEQAKAAAQRQAVPSQITAQLNEPVEHLRFRETSLAQFAEFVSQWCGVPVVVNERALKAAGYPRVPAVNVEIQSGTLKQAIEAALAPHHLHCISRNGQLVIEPLATVTVGP